MSDDLAAGWYSDADGKKRYWDGQSWSDFKFEGHSLSVADAPDKDSERSSDADVASESVASASGHHDPAIAVVTVSPADTRRGRRLRVILSASIVLLLLVGGGVWWKTSTDAQAAQAAAEEVAEKKAEDKKRKDGIARAEKAADGAERARRKQTVIALEASIVEDATQSVADGWFEGPILSSTCTATGGGSTDDLTALTGTFECIAVTKVEGTQSSGYAYSATIDWSTGSYSWRPGT